MSDAKVHQPKYLLAKKLRSGAAMVSASRAVAQARQGVESLRAATLQALDQELAQLEALNADAGQPGIARLDAAAIAADRIVGLSGGLDTLADLAQGALGLSRLLETLQEAQVWDADSIGVHIAALRLLRQNKAGGAEPVLVGLERVRKRVIASRLQGAS